MANYLPLSDFPGYKVGDDGTVWSQRSCHGVLSEWHVLKPQGRRGYLRVRLYRADGWHVRSVHVLVLETFVGPRPDGMEACHRDNDRRNNALDNLRWDTQVGNQADSDHKRRRGAAHSDAKLSEDMIPSIVARVSAGESRRSVARSLGVSHVVINAVVNGSAWKHVARAA